MHFCLGREVLSTDRFSNTLILLSCIFLLKMKSFYVEILSLVTGDLVSNSRLANRQTTWSSWARFNRSPAQKHDPTNNTLHRVLPTSSKLWLESTNQDVLQRLLMQIEEESSINARVVLFLDASKALLRPSERPALSSTNVLSSSKRGF